MEIVLIVGFFCALIFLIHVSDKNAERPTPLESPKVTLPPPPKRFVSVVFKEGRAKLYDYFVGENYDLRVGDSVEVPVRNKFTGESELKIATVKYVSQPGERSERAWATVIGRVTYQPPPAQPIYTPQPVYRPQPTQTFSHPRVSPTPQPTVTRDGKTFVQVIFKKNGKKRFDYLLGAHYDLRVGDFVVVHVNSFGKATWKIAKIVYISKPGEVSEYAKSEIIKKADYPKW